MSRAKTEDTNIVDFSPLVSPCEIKARHPLSDLAAETVDRARRQIRRILHGEDQRLLMICGPCSIHNVDQALEYAQKLRQLRHQVGDQLLLVMRVYFEKPRTQKGWRGLIIDPHLDGSSDITGGIDIARRLLLQLAEQDIPAATEVLDPIIPHYIADLVSWAAIGARTTESQIHREITSGLSMPVGFKNSTDGSIQNSLNAMHVALSAHKFIGIDNDGRLSLITSTGNADVHLILRGGHQGPNYQQQFVDQACQLLKQQHLTPAVIVDCSHANSYKDYRRQAEVCLNVVQQRLGGQKGVVGLMLESHLCPGQQKIGAQPLAWGVSLTDSCIGWQETEELLVKVAALLRQSQVPGSTN